MAFTEEGLFLMSSYAAYYEFGTTIVLDDFKNVRRTVSVMTEDLIATGLEENMPIDEETYAILAAGCETYEAAARGINLLGYSDKSKRAMALALHRKGFDKDISVRAADVLEEYGYIDEVRQIERRAEVMIRKKYGKSRIMSDLHVKGYDLSRVDEWVSGESFQSIDFGALCADYVRERGGFPSEYPEKRRFVTSLYRMGYGAAEIKRAASILRNEEEEQEGEPALTV